MKKKLLHIIFLLYSMASFSQHTYLLEYKASFSTSSIQPGWGVRISYLEDGVAKSIYNVTTTPPNANSGSVDTFYVFSTSKEITALGASCLSVSGTLTSCTAGNHTSDIQTVNNSCTSDSGFIMEAVNKNRCVSGSVSKFNLIKIEDFKTINNYSATNNELKICEAKSLLMSTNCKYALEYKIESNTDWEELLTYGNNPTTVNVNPSDISGLNIGQNLQIRIRYAPLKGETNVNAYSGILSYSINGCSPEIDNVQVQKTNCNYSSDGSFIINFKRDLKTSENENLVITLYDQNDENILYGQEFTNALVNNGNGTFGYTWQDGLDAGSYKIKYQTQNVGGGIDPNDASWDTLDFYENISVTNPAEVTFSITGISDQNCFEINDGYIDVDADGESGRTYLYQLKREEIVQFFNGTSWVDYTGSNENIDTWFAFENVKTTRINKLSKGKY